MLTDRKARLFAVAACRRISPLLTDERSRRAVIMAEVEADGLLVTLEEQNAAALAWVSSRDAWIIARQDAPKAAATSAAGAAFFSILTSAWQAAMRIAGPAAAAEAKALAGNAKTRAERKKAQAAARRATNRAQCVLLRCIFNPFRPFTPLDPAVLPPQVVTLAKSIYDFRSFDRLPELASRLEAGGCTDALPLDHLRGAGPHVRGCFALDLILGLG